MAEVPFRECRCRRSETNPLVTSNLQEITAFLHEKIPITRAMGIEVEYFNSEQLILTAPLEANHNHLGTAFGGSLSALATLAGYGFIWLELGDRESHVVIRDSSLSFRRPVTGNLRAICHRPEESALAEFRKQFQATGKAKIRLAVVIKEKELVAVEFSGTFVAIR